MQTKQQTLPRRGDAPVLVDHRISKKEAIDYVAAFVSEFQGRGVSTLGGYLSKKAFLDMGFCIDKTASNADGILAWYALDQQDPSKLILAFEREIAYPMDQPYEKFETTENERIFKVAMDMMPMRDAVTYGVEHLVTVGTNNIPESEFALPEATVAEMVTRFQLQFQKTAGGSPYNFYPFAFFHKEQFERFLNQSGVEGVRYYFGYSASLVNKIRLVLVAVDSHGRNITGALEDGEVAMFLQKSWPPPPNGPIWQ